MSAASMTVCVFCGSRPGIRPEYRAVAHALGVELAQRSISLMYGGATIGLMGAVAEGCLSAGGEVLGILPTVLLPYEIAHQGLTTLTIADSMHDRKALMYQGANAFIVLPGGVGTLDELFEIVTWAHIRLHAKPIALVNIAGFFDPLLQYLEHAASEGFLNPPFHTFARVYGEDAIPQMLTDLQRAWADNVQPDPNE
jgi:uncharacterized protein (TIGR00730 family)